MAFTKQYNNEALIVCLKGSTLRLVAASHGGDLIVRETKNRQHPPFVLTAKLKVGMTCHI
jgi:hypothetical protein